MPTVRGTSLSLNKPSTIISAFSYYIIWLVLVFCFNELVNTDNSVVHTNELKVWFNLIKTNWFMSKVLNINLSLQFQKPKSAHFKTWRP